MKQSPGFRRTVVTLVVAYLSTFAAHALDANEKENPFVGEWLITPDSAGGKAQYIVIIFPDLSGVFKQVDDLWISKLSKVSLESETLKFRYEYGGDSGIMVDFAGSVEDGMLKGSLGKGAKGGGVTGKPYTFESPPGEFDPILLVGAWSLTTDWGSGDWQYFLVVFNDLSGVVKSMEDGTLSEIWNAESKDDGSTFSFAYDEADTIEIDFRGTVEDDRIEGTFYSGGKEAAVAGKRTNEK